MTDKPKDRNAESPLVAVVKTEGHLITLITPHGEYSFNNGELSSIKQVKDYEGRVSEMFSELAEYAKVAPGVLSDRAIRIQFKNGAPPIYNE